MPRSRSAPRLLRLEVSLHRGGLDRQLADGCSPERSAALKLRARQLTSRARRRSLARSLRGVVTECEKRYVMPRSAVPICRRAVLPWREAIFGLADRLEQACPVNPCGVARVMVLLTESVSPFYDPRPVRSMGETIWWIADGLQGCPPHAWGCPKIMKLDPEHVAWTCGRCGAIAKTDDPSVRPA